VSLWPTCLDIPVGCDINAPLIWCPQNDLSAQCRPCCIHTESCRHLVSLSLGCFWQYRGDWIIFCGVRPQIWRVRPALCWFCWMYVWQRAGMWLEFVLLFVDIKLMEHQCHIWLQHQPGTSHFIPSCLLHPALLGKQLRLYSTLFTWTGKMVLVQYITSAFYLLPKLPGCDAGST
jgi:hypothetical protein